MQRAVALYEQNLALMSPNDRGSSGYSAQAQSLASALVKLARYAEAVEVYEELLQLPETQMKDPKNGNVLGMKHMYAGALYHLKRYEKSKSLLLMIQGTVESCVRSEAQKLGDLPNSVDRYLAACIEATNDLTLGASRASTRVMNRERSSKSPSVGDASSIEDFTSPEPVCASNKESDTARRPLEPIKSPRIQFFDDSSAEVRKKSLKVDKTRSQAGERSLASKPVGISRRPSSPRGPYTTERTASPDIRRVKSDQALKSSRTKSNQDVPEISRPRSSQTTARTSDNIRIDRDPLGDKVASRSNTRNANGISQQSRSPNLPPRLASTNISSGRSEKTTHSYEAQRGAVSFPSNISKGERRATPTENRHATNETLVLRPQIPDTSSRSANRQLASDTLPNTAQAHHQGPSVPTSSRANEKIARKRTEFSHRPQDKQPISPPDIVLDGDASTSLLEPPSQAENDAGSLFGPSSTAHDADKWFYQVRHYVHNLLYNEEPKNPGRRKVRIAILDSGPAPSLGTVRVASVERRIRNENAIYMDFTGSANPWSDSNSDFHGTKCATLLMQMAPQARLYIANVVKPGVKGQDPNHVAAALAWARENEVDIISMSFGWDYLQPQVAAEIALARNQHILLFAAASNDGDLTPDHGKYPAWDNNVYSVYSCRGCGQKSEFNPRALTAQINFMFPGEDIAILDAKNRALEGVGRLKGTSYATPIAAGTAAVVLDLVLLSLTDSTEVEKRLKQHLGMSDVFRAMSGMARDEGYFHVRPWTLLGFDKPFPSPHNVNETHQWFTLMRVLGYLRRFGDYDKPLM